MMHHLFSLMVAGVVILLAGCGAPAPQKPAFYTDLARAGVTVDVADANAMINLYRRNNQLGDVVVDPRLSTLARAYADDLASAAQKGATIKPDGKLAGRLATASLAGAVAKESVSAGYYTVAEAFSGWRQSDRHRAVMLMPEATIMGLAATYRPGTKYKVYWVLILAKPTA